jgi:hypothetical protein
MAQPCGKVDFMIGKEQTLERYPDCAGSYDGSHPGQNVLVKGNINGGTDETGATFNLNFGMAVWLALFLHTLGVEIYVSIAKICVRLVEHFD